MRQLFRQFSFPGGVPSHVAPETPGSIHEGGELGYVLTHAFGAALAGWGSRRLQRLDEELAGVGDFRRGSVSENYRRCGKATTSGST